MAFHPTQPLAFALAENSSELHVLDIANGLLTRRPNGSVFTQQDEAYHWSSDVQINPTATHLYAVNRTPSEIVRFGVAADGSLSRGEAVALSGTVRSFAIDGTGQFLLVGGNSGEVVSYRISADSGQLSESARLAGLGNVNATVVRHIR